MEVYRICKTEYSKQILASGSPNRWNMRDQYVVYTSSTRSLSTLEMVVHRNAISSISDYKILVISIEAESKNVHTIDLQSLPENWRTLAAYSMLQNIGSEWYNKQESLLFKVPSAVIPQEYNFVINTKHPDFRKKVQLVSNEDYFWDKRLL